jgi:hypothetical protein
VTEASGPYTVEVHDRVDGGDTWEPIESGWECHNPFADRDDAHTVARTLALRAGGEREYRVVSADRSPLATYLVTRRLQVRCPGAGAHDRVEVTDLPAGMEVPMVSEALEHAKRSH